MRMKHSAHTLSINNKSLRIFSPTVGDLVGEVTFGEGEEGGGEKECGKEERVAAEGGQREEACETVHRGRSF